MAVRAAVADDLRSICKLLADAKLPITGVEEHLDTFLVIESEGAVVGAAGLEIYQSAGLVRSLVVSSSQEGRGFATRICDRLESLAATRGVTQLYLLTETAASFFAKRGYSEVTRGAAPPQIENTREFSEICPQSAVFMRRAV